MGVRSRVRVRRAEGMGANTVTGDKVSVVGSGGVLVFFSVHESSN
jgi:hypothetical protein